MGQFLLNKYVLTAYRMAALFLALLRSYGRLEETDSKQNKYEMCMYVI